MLACMFVVLVQVREIECICLHVCTYESVCACVRMHICENSLVNVYVSASMRACVCACTCVCMRMCICSARKSLPILKNEMYAFVPSQTHCALNDTVVLLVY